MFLFFLYWGLSIRPLRPVGTFSFPSTHIPALCTRRLSLLPIELFASLITLPGWQEDDQNVAFRGSKSRNKVSLGEPAENHHRLEGGDSDCFSFEQTILLRGTGDS